MNDRQAPTHLALVDLTTLVGDETYPFIVGNSGLVGYGHQDKTAFVAEARRYAAAASDMFWCQELDSGRSGEDEVVHRYAHLDEDHEGGFYHPTDRDDPRAFPITVL